MKIVDLTERLLKDKSKIGMLCPPGINDWLNEQSFEEYLEEMKQEIMRKYNVDSETAELISEVEELRKFTIDNVNSKANKTINNIISSRHHELDDDLPF